MEKKIKKYKLEIIHGIRYSPSDCVDGEIRIINLERPTSWEKKIKFTHLPTPLYCMLKAALDNLELKDDDLYCECCGLLKEIKNL